MKKQNDKLVKQEQLLKQLSADEKWRRAQERGIIPPPWLKKPPIRDSSE